MANGLPMMRRTILALIFGAASIGAQAQTWISLGKSSAAEMFLDVASIRPQGQYIKAWSGVTYSTEQASNGYPSFKYMATRELAYYDCKNVTAATKQLAFYADPTGLSTYVYGYTVKESLLSFDDPIPGTFGETALRMVCARRN